MPLDEEGAKWSCEPCIRGHRSSKCQHFDRLMMKVPKAGRPLQKCPHPKGTCSCQKLYAFMVRIPKGSTCLCRPLYKVPMAPGEAGQQQQQQQQQQKPQQQSNFPSSPTLAGASTTGVTSAPVTPATPSASANRIQKRSRRQNSIQASADSVSRGLGMLASPVQVKNETSTPGNPSADDSIAVANEKPGSGLYQKTESPDTSTTVTHTPQNGGCCGSKRSSNASFSVNVMDNIQKAPGYQLASSSIDTPLQSHPIQHNLFHKSVSTPTISEPNHSPAPFLLNSLESEYPHYPPTAHSVPPSSFNPQPAKNHHFNSFDQFGPPDNLPPGLHTGFGPASSQVGCKGHNCGCGDGCQCLGCASHPYNDTTRHYIQEMGYMMASGYSDKGPEGNDDVHSPPYSACLPPEPHPLAAVGQNHFSQGYVHSAQFQPQLLGYGDNSNNNPSIPATMPQHASDGELMMSPTAYYTVEYPISMLDPCTNLTGTCQCGINCACVGCLTHHGHNGISAESSPPPDIPQVSDSGGSTQQAASFFSMQTQTPPLSQIQMQTDAQAHPPPQVSASSGYNPHYPGHAPLESPPA
ncbi:Copper-fist domain-containing protein [Trichophyton interdigitale]|uniref:Copper-fist domain-containing protein n=1 Tax=Trichophyton interdigitale TaxID=101480 RepID=A0A9P4YDG5_9EURO|nr:Copper-fist domain-containing protein [Trichophyton interdigitale]KAF3893244.1 Copper-fist domain-containing protein [Trichophyton interdigitale]KAG8205687.1 Copper-fist domain-containing protein [Trichophyton interdigitale]